MINPQILKRLLRNWVFSNTKWILTPRRGLSSHHLPANDPFPNLKDHLVKFSGNIVTMGNKHLFSFSNDCINIGTNNDDVSICIFINSLEGSVAIKFFELPDIVFLTWDELTYWFKSNFGNVENPVKHLKIFNNITLKKGEAVKAFNLHFRKLYNRITKAIPPSS